MVLLHNPLRSQQHSRLSMVLLVIGLVLCWGAVSAQTTSKDTGTLVVGLWTEPNNLDPGVEMNVASSKSTMMNIYEGLVTYDGSSLEVKPRLAKSWAVANGATEFTFHLQQGVRFQDGTEFNAQAVVTNIKRIQTLNRTPATFISGVQTVEATDPLTVVFKLKAPDAFFVDKLAWILMVSPKAISEHDNGDLATGWLRNHTDGTGPYQLTEWTPGQMLVLDRFPDYWRGWDHPYLSKIVERVINEPNTQRLLLERGGIDIAQNVTVDEVPALKQNKKIMVVKDVGLSQFQLMLNTQHGPMANVKVRKAIEYAFDYEAHNEGAMRGTVARATTPFPAEMVNGLPDVTTYNTDVEKARQLLSEAGYPNGGFTLQYRFITGFAEEKAVGAILQASLKPLGINVQIGEAPWPTLLQSLENPNTAFDIWPYYVEPKIDSPDEYLTNLYATSAQGANGRNFSYYSNPTVDELLAKAPTVLDRNQRDEVYRKVARIIANDAVAIVVNRASVIQAMGTWVKGYEGNPLKPYMLDFYSMYIEGKH